MSEQMQLQDFGEVIARFPGPQKLGAGVAEEYAIVAAPGPAVVVLACWKGTWRPNPSGKATVQAVALGLLAAISRESDRGGSARDVLDSLAAHAYFAEVLRGVDLSDQSQWGEEITDPAAYLSRRFPPES